MCPSDTDCEEVALRFFMVASPKDAWVFLLLRSFMGSPSNPFRLLGQSSMKVFGWIDTVYVPLTVQVDKRARPVEDTWSGKVWVVP